MNLWNHQVWTRCWWECRDGRDREIYATSFVVGRKIPCIGEQTRVMAHLHYPIPTLIQFPLLVPVCSNGREQEWNSLRWMIHEIIYVASVKYFKYQFIFYFFFWINLLCSLQESSCRHWNYWYRRHRRKRMVTQVCKLRHSLLGSVQDI